MNVEVPLFFLGANAPGGFVSRFSEVYDVREGWRAYILKGGPGTGKSTLMKRVAAEALARGQAVWCSPCSSDPESLDAVVLPDMRTCVMDGTAPHVIEPKHPGMCEILVNLGDHYDTDLLALSADRLYAKFADNAALHKRAARYISAAGQVLSDNLKLAGGCTDIDKAAAYGASLARRLLPKCRERAGLEQVRFLSAVTPKGYLCLSSTVGALCPTVKVISDRYGAASAAAMSAFRLVALERGYDIISCRSPFFPQGAPEHLLVPEAGVAFCTCSDMLPIAAERLIRADRFTDGERLRRHKQRLSFNRRATAELISAACDTLTAAKAVHDQMESYYIKAMDFDALSARTERLVADIFD
jgi:hypothetical protein